MEYIYLFAGLIVAFFCIWCYQKGVKDGIAVKNGHTPDPLNPIKKIIDNHEEAKKRSEQHDKEKSIEDQMQALSGYQPEFTGEKDK